MGAGGASARSKLVDDRRTAALHGKQRSGVAASTAWAVSEENVEMRNEAVRRFVAAFEDKDDAFRAALHPTSSGTRSRRTGRPPEASMRPCGTGISGSKRGKDQLHVEEVIEDGDDVVVGVQHQSPGSGQRGRGRRPLLRAVQGAGRQGRLHLRPRRSSGSPRSRGAVGVGPDSSHREVLTLLILLLMQPPRDLRGPALGPWWRKFAWSGPANSG